MKRTDIHCPSKINPIDYEYVAFEVVPRHEYSSIYFAMSERQKITEHMAKTGGTYSDHEHGGNCMVCGSVNAIYTVLFYHLPTNVYIRMGTDCAEKCDLAFVKDDINAFKKKVKAAAEAKAGKAKAETFLNSEGCQGAWDIYTAENVPMKYEENTIRDIVRRLVVYGHISDKQLNFLRKLLTQINDRSQIEAKREAERLAAHDVPTGTSIVTGTVLSLRVDDSPYGPQTKMLVQSDTFGWKIWGTRPTNLATIVKGCRVEFVATLSPSDKDPKFGFFSRPRNAKELVA